MNRVRYHLRLAVLFVVCDIESKKLTVETN